MARTALSSSVLGVPAAISDFEKVPSGGRNGGLLWDVLGAQSVTKSNLRQRFWGTGRKKPRPKRHRRNLRNYLKEGHSLPVWVPGPFLTLSRY
jgi:hypothetical protein